MKKIWHSVRNYFKEAFAGVTWAEGRGAFFDTLKDLVTSWREPVTVLALSIAGPPGAMLVVYPVYRLRLYRAKIGVIDAAPEPLLSDARLRAIGGAIRSAPARAAKAVWGATPLAMKTTGAAIALGGAGVSTYATVQSFGNPAIMNYSLLKECNEAMRRQQPCTAAGAAEKQKSNRAIKNLSLFAGGGVAIGAGALVFGAAGRRRK